MERRISNRKIFIIFGVIILIYLICGIIVALWRLQSGSFESVTLLSDSSGSIAASTVVGKIDDYDEGRRLAELAALEAAGKGQGADGSGDGSETGGGALNTDMTAGADGSTRFFRFTVTTRIQRLHLREAPSLMATILDYLPKGTTGYVIFSDPEWSYIATDDGRIGYSFNGYLALTEILPEEYPAQYLPQHR